jgi:predicted DNA-binding transcriptional regulator AlpA
MTCRTCTSKAIPPLEPILVDARRAAEMCGVSRSTWLGWDAAGLNPSPIRLGGRVLWAVEHLRTWAVSGCPSRQEIEAAGEGDRDE